MDAKDQRTEGVLSESINNGSSNYTRPAFQSADKNKSYLDIGSSSSSKVGVRPCAIIGPDRVVPPHHGPADAKRAPTEPWSFIDHGYQPPQFQYKLSDYQNPSRNISPRQTFQENMPRIMVPRYNPNKASEDHNFGAEKNNAATKPSKLHETKYPEVPYTANQVTIEQKHQTSPDVVGSISENLLQAPPQGWPPEGPGHRPSHPYNYPEMYQYPVYAARGALPVIRTQRANNEDPAHMYPDYYRGGNVRFEPYPAMKERYPPPRYEYIANYPSPYQRPLSHYPPQKYDLQKHHPSVPQHPQYVGHPQAAFLRDPVLENYQRHSKTQPNFNVPYHGQAVHAKYNPIPGNIMHNKLYQYPPAEHANYSPVSMKPPYDTNKYFVKYDHSQSSKPCQTSESYGLNEFPRTNLKNQMMIPNYPLNMHHLPYYRKDNMPSKTHDLHPSYRTAEPFYNNLQSRVPSHFSPGIISLSDSVVSNEISSPFVNQEDFGYASQSSTASARSTDPNMYKMYDSRYRHVMGAPAVSRMDINSSNTDNSEKKKLNVRQFLQSWNEEDDENSEKTNSKDKVVETSGNTRKHCEVVNNPEQLYVLGLVNVPSDELSKYEHIQKVSKLPENIKGYTSIELLNQFEEVIESNNMSSYSTKASNHKLPHTSINAETHTKSIGIPNRPVSPLDVESKISQSIIHKEVGCNFEIRPCSPQMLNAQVAAPVHSLLGERHIEKVTNTVNSNLIPNCKDNCDVIKRSTQRTAKEPEMTAPSCKMIKSQYPESMDLIDPVKTSYSLQDLESNSGVCLASLPRLDNDIELSFPEVNQQFINANRSDVHTDLSVKESPLASSQPINNVVEETNVVSESNKPVSVINKKTTSTYSSTPNCTDDHKELQPADAQLLRTNSVIIKNPEKVENNNNVDGNQPKQSKTNLESCQEKIPLSEQSNENKTLTAVSPPRRSNRKEHNQQEKNKKSVVKEAIMQDCSPKMTDIINEKNTETPQNNLAKVLDDNKNEETEKHFNDQTRQNKITISSNSKIDLKDQTKNLNDFGNNNNCLAEKLLLPKATDNHYSKMPRTKSIFEPIEFVSLNNNKDKPSKQEIKISAKESNSKENKVSEENKKCDPEESCDPEKSCELPDKNTMDIDSLKEREVKFHHNADITKKTVKSTHSELEEVSEHCDATTNALKETEKDNNNEQTDNACCNSEPYNFICIDKDEKVYDASQSEITQKDTVADFQVCYNKNIDHGYDMSVENIIHKQTSTQDEKNEKNEFPKYNHTFLESPKYLASENEGDIYSKNSTTSSFKMFKTQGKNKYVNVAFEIDSGSFSKSNVLVESDTAAANLIDTEDEVKTSDKVDNLKETDIDGAAAIYNLGVTNNKNQIFDSKNCKVDNGLMNSLDRCLLIESAKSALNRDVSCLGSPVSPISSDTDSDHIINPNSTSNELWQDELENNNSLLESIAEKNTPVSKSCVTDFESNDLSTVNVDRFEQASCPLTCFATKVKNDLQHDEKGNEKNTSRIGESVSAVTKKEMFSPRFQNLILFVEGFCSTGNRQQIDTETGTSLFDSAENQENIIIDCGEDNETKPSLVTSNDEKTFRALSEDISGLETIECSTAHVLVDNNNFNNDEYNTSLHPDSEKIYYEGSNNLQSEPLSCHQCKNIISSEQFNKGLCQQCSLLDRKVIPQKYSPVKYRKTRTFKRSLSDSALCDINCPKPQSDLNSEEKDTLWLSKKRKDTKESSQNPTDHNTIYAEPNNYCNVLPMNRRYSISSTYEGNISFCILIDDNCIIAEEQEEDEEAICFTGIVQENLESSTGDDSVFDENNEVETLIAIPKEDVPSSEIYPFDYQNETNVVHSWEDDVACVETVVSDDIEIENDAIRESSPLLNSDDSQSNEEHTRRIKQIYGDEICSNDIDFIKTLYITPQMDLNRTLLDREFHVTETECRFENYRLEQILSGYEDNVLIPNAEESAKVESKVVSSICKEILINNDSRDDKDLPNKKSQVETVMTHDLKNAEEIFSHLHSTSGPEFKRSSCSPEVSSTTSEEKKTEIIMKIRNYEETITQNDNEDSEIKKLRCKLTEASGYLSSKYESVSRKPLLTKAAQKYIPPIKESTNDLKIKLFLPEQSLTKLKQLKLTSAVAKINTNKLKKNVISKDVRSGIIKKSKPKFEDVLKNIDVAQIKMLREKSKKNKISIPKVIIKKTENGSHYTSSACKTSYNPDLTGRKWQPWVFIERNPFIEKLALRGKRRVIYCHRKKAYISFDKFRKYKSVCTNSTSFIISSPSNEHVSGPLKYTIRLKRD